MLRFGGQESFEQIFRMYDKDQTGNLDEAEFARVCEDMGFGSVSHDLFIEVPSPRGRRTPRRRSPAARHRATRACSAPPRAVPARPRAHMHHPVLIACRLCACGANAALPLAAGR